jgi:hypothetical protein
MDSIRGGTQKHGFNFRARYEGANDGLQAPTNLME